MRILLWLLLVVLAILAYRTHHPVEVMGFNVERPQPYLTKSSGTNHYMTVSTTTSNPGLVFSSQGGGIVTCISDPPGSVMVEKAQK